MVIPQIRRGQSRQKSMNLWFARPWMVTEMRDFPLNSVYLVNNTTFSMGNLSLTERRIFFRGVKFYAVCLGMREAVDPGWMA